MGEKIAKIMRTKEIVVLYVKHGSSILVNATLRIHVELGKAFLVGIGMMVLLTALIPHMKFTASLLSTQEMVSTLIFMNTCNRKVMAHVEETC